MQNTHAHTYLFIVTHTKLRNLRKMHTNISIMVWLIHRSTFLVIHKKGIVVKQIQIQMRRVRGRVWCVFVCVCE